MWAANTQKKIYSKMTIQNSSFHLCCDLCLAQEHNTDIGCMGITLLNEVHEAGAEIRRRSSCGNERNKFIWKPHISNKQKLDWAFFLITIAQLQLCGRGVSQSYSQTHCRADVPIQIEWDLVSFFIASSSEPCPSKCTSLDHMLTSHRQFIDKNKDRCDNLR